MVCANFAHTTQHGAIQGKTQETNTKCYNLDVIISVGYRVKSKRGTQFRQWATQRLKELLLNQFDSNRLASDKLNENITYEIQYDEALSAIAELKRQLIKKKEARIGRQCFAYNVKFSNPNN